MEGKIRMAMYLTRQPMTKGQFDAALAAIGWRRDNDEACDRARPDIAFISDIDKVPSADGRRRIMFEGHRVEECGTLLHALDCLDEANPAFWAILGIEIEVDGEDTSLN